MLGSSYYRYLYNTKIIGLQSGAIHIEIFGSGEPNLPQNKHTLYYFQQYYKHHLPESTPDPNLFINMIFRMLVCVS